MKTTLRRFLLLWAFMFWHAGFTFYATVVVPIGTEFLDSARKQGVITSQVTNILNVAGAVALLLLLWDLFAERGNYLRSRWGCWAALALMLGALVMLHHWMDGQFDLASRDFADHRAFRQLHRWYLRISSVQWFVAIGMTILTLHNWRTTDRQT